jgi:hypothetical protein
MARHRRAWLECRRLRHTEMFDGLESFVGAIRHLLYYRSVRRKCQTGECHRVGEKGNGLAILCFCGLCLKYNLLRDGKTLDVSNLDRRVGRCQSKGQQSAASRAGGSRFRRRAAAHQLGAKMLEQLLRAPAEFEREVPCPCGRRARFSPDASEVPGESPGVGRHRTPVLSLSRLS